MKDKIETIFQNLPSKWEEVTIADFIKLSEIEVDENYILEEGKIVENLFVGHNNIIKVISVLTNVTVDEIENYSFQSIAKLSKKLDFMLVEPVPNKTSKLKWKSVNEISYDGYVTFQQFGNDFMKHLAIIIPKFVKNEVSEEEILKMNMVDAYTAFFFAKEGVKEITSQHDSLFKVESQISDNEGMDSNSIQKEMQEAIKKEHELYGWHFLANDVSDFTKISMFEVYDRSAMEILSIVRVMQAKIRVNQNKN
jgi:hypothetical protein